jgi:hypothetical protein
MPHPKLDVGMEWMLQIADEFDDAVSVLRHGWSGLIAEIGALLLAALGVGAAIAGLRLGAEPASIATAAVAANFAALLKIRGARVKSVRMRVWRWESSERP